METPIVRHLIVCDSEGQMMPTKEKDYEIPVRILPMAELDAAAGNPVDPQAIGGLVRHEKVLPIAELDAQGIVQVPEITRSDLKPPA